MTKTEMARLVRKARAAGSFAIGGRSHIREFYCPAHREALDSVHDRSLPHRFTVEVHPWEDPTTVAAVTKALRSHIEDAATNGEPCTDPAKSSRQ